MKKNIESIFKPHPRPKEIYRGGSNPAPTLGKVHKLSSNENPLGASPKAVAALKACLDRIDRYPDQTDIRLREALVQDFDGQLDLDQFITGNSGSEILDMLIRALIGEGDQIIMSNPCFLPYAVFSRWYGGQPIDVPLKGPGYALDVEGILGAITERTKIIFLCSPNNPTGTHIPKDVLDGFMEAVPGNILIVFDEVYRHFATAQDYVSALPYVLQGHNVLGLNSFSKTYGLAGQRIGYAYSTLPIAQYLRLIQKPFLLPLTSLEAAIAALEDTEFVQRTVDTVIQGRDFLAGAFEALGIPHWPSQANFFLIDPPLPEMEFVDRMLEEGIMVRPVTQFGAPGKVRISIGDPGANADLVKALERILATAKGAGQVKG